jgi:hypothetical protein
LEDLANPITVPFPSISSPAGTHDPLQTASMAPRRAPPSSRSSPSGGSLPPTQQPPLAVSSASPG